MDQLERECYSFTKYLTGLSPSPYVLEKYRDWHVQSGVMAELEADPFDQHLVEVAARGPRWARLADSYASRFRKDSILRKKLVATLAILECVLPASAVLDLVDRGGAAGAILRLSCAGAVYAASVAASIVIFTPARLRLSGAGGGNHAMALER